ncbi:MAG TPA: prepilin-type N-terminal cleavage/methylation domain-containing protein [Terriglobales bacterium]|jgi:prepilin-type N-terminal cleavage/methylation domain-containing protein|nr:prepilin-type N-terminal cleavage/methylation domain-containing protein [Terriglobales bacterium]
MRKAAMRGFSLIEMMAVISVMLVVTAMAVTMLMPDVNNSRVVTAYNTTLLALRQARDISIAQRQVYFVTFIHNAAPPDEITITQGGSGTVVNTYQLPLDMAFIIVPGVPTGAGKTPDGFGNGSTAIAFDQGIGGGNPDAVYFYPDGSAQDVNGNINNGVVYVARASDLYSSRAVTVWGATGRLRGWRLYNSNGTNYWRQM